MLNVALVLCPVDFSETARHAVHYAVALANRFGATVTVLHVVLPIMPLFPEAEPEAYPAFAYTPEDLERFTEQTRKFVEHESKGPGVRVVPMVVIGIVTDEIVRAAETLPADLIVIGTNGRSGVERLLLGSVTERVLRKANRPILAVPPRAPDAQPTTPLVFKRILCAVDFSPASLKALDYAASLAAEPGVHLTVLSVLELPPIFEPVMVGGPGLPEYEVRARQAVEERLHELVAKHVRRRDGVTALALVDKPYRGILRAASEEHSDLIAIGIHGGGSGRLALGSTTSHVVRGAACPVLIAKA